MKSQDNIFVASQIAMRASQDQLPQIVPGQKVGNQCQTPSRSVSVCLSTSPLGPLHEAEAPRHAFEM